MEGLGNLDKLGGIALHYATIKVAHGGNSHDINPLLIFVEYIEHLIELNSRSNTLRTVSFR